MCDHTGQEADEANEAGDQRDGESHALGRAQAVRVGQIGDRLAGHHDHLRLREETDTPIRRHQGEELVRAVEQLERSLGTVAVCDAGLEMEVAAQYEARTGHPLRALDWFEVYAALRFAIVSVRTSTRGIAYGQMEKPDDPDDLVMFRSLLDRMLDTS